jgi:hypothetical protein
VNGASIPVRCELCRAHLDGHNITGLCQECKLILRNKRMTPCGDQQPVTGPSVSLAQAIGTAAAVLGAHVVVPHLYGSLCRCGKALARNDTGMCEWCTAKARRS